MIRTTTLIAGLSLLAACGGFRDDLAERPEPLGDFRLGFGLAVAPDPTVGPFSRTVENEVWVEAVQAALADRLGRYEGSAFYHVGVAVEGYVLAQPGIPVVYSPKSVLIFSVNFYEDSTQQRLNEEPIQLTVFEPCCDVPLIGSGFTRSAEEQLEGLAFNAARAIERTMRENAQWFGGAPELQAADATIVTGNILVEDPGAVAPDETQ